MYCQFATLYIQYYSFKLSSLHVGIWDGTCFINKIAKFSANTMPVCLINNSITYIINNVIYHLHMLINNVIFLWDSSRRKEHCQMEGSGKHFSTALVIFVGLLDCFSQISF